MRNNAGRALALRLSRLGGAWIRSLVSLPRTPEGSGGRLL